MAACDPGPNRGEEASRPRRRVVGGVRYRPEEAAEDFAVLWALCR